MRYYATASGPKVREAMTAGLLAQIRTPDAGNRLIPGVRWVADNGCFKAWKSGEAFDFWKWWAWLDRQPRTADWVVVPDVVCDHEATLQRWHRIAPLVKTIGFRTAFVAQNGCTPDEIPGDAECVFIGGDDDWKESPMARACVEEAQRRGITTHMGRVNTLRRLRLAVMWGIDSVDGTKLAFGPDENLPPLLDWLRRTAGGVSEQLELLTTTPPLAPCSPGSERGEARS